jgi:hypothetical protein
VTGPDLSVLFTGIGIGLCLAVPMIFAREAAAYLLRRKHR